MIARLLSLDGLVAFTAFLAAVTSLRDYLVLGTGKSPTLGFVQAHLYVIAFLIFLLFATRRKPEPRSFSNVCRVVVRLFALASFGWLVFLPYSLPLIVVRHWRIEALLLVFIAHQVFAYLNSRNGPEPILAPRPAIPRAALLASFIVFAAGTIIFADSLQDYFLCDDFTILKHLSGVSFLGLFRGFVRAQPGMTVLRPATFLSWKLDYTLWGDSPIGFHLTNTILHGLNAVLVFLIARRIFRSLGAGLVAGLLFALHPAHADAVIFISARYGVLCTFFYLLSFLSFIAFLSNRHRSLYAASLIFFAMALANKETALTLPIALAAYDLLVDSAAPSPKLWSVGDIVARAPSAGQLRRPFRASLRAVVVRQTPFFALMGLYFAWRFLLLGGLSLPQTAQGSFTLFDSGLVGLEARLIRSPLRYLFFPSGGWHPDWTSYLYVALFASICVVLYLRRDFLLRRAGLFAFLFVFIAAITGASIAIYPDLSGIRVLYLPSAGLAMLLGLFLRHGLPRGSRARWPTIALTALIIGGYIAGSLVNHSAYHEASVIAYEVAHAPSRFYPSFPVPHPTIYIVDVPRLFKGAKLFECGLPEAVERTTPGSKVVFVHDDAWLPGMRSRQFDDLLHSGQLELGSTDFVFRWDRSSLSLKNATDELAAAPSIPPP